MSMLAKPHKDKDDDGSNHINNDDDGDDDNEKEPSSCSRVARIPDVEETTEEPWLPSFAAIKAKTQATLYGSSSSNNTSAVMDTNRRDKSPKGSVDEAIRPLVDLINRHPAYATLSSCSGRIALFHPRKQRVSCDDDDSASPHEPSLAETNRHDETGVTSSSVADGGANTTIAANGSSRSSGKGSGGWIFVSHDPIQTSDLVHVMDREQQQPRAVTAANSSNSGIVAIPGRNEAEENPIASATGIPPKEQEENGAMFLDDDDDVYSLKLEPFLLHVAAANLTRGQALCQLAMERGLRESGLVVTPSRVTVAIRSYALALSVPLTTTTRGGSRDDYHSSLLSLSPAYLEGWTRLANRKLRQNHQRLADFQSHFLQRFFRLPTLELRCRCAGSAPPLNLWGHTSVAVPPYARRTAAASTAADEDDNELRHGSNSIFVFGGYGRGPSLLLLPTGGGEEVPSPRSGPARSDQLYQLVLRKEGAEDQAGKLSSQFAWKLVSPATTTGSNNNESSAKVEDWYGLSTTSKNCFWTAREGVRACVWELPPSSTLDENATTLRTKTLFLLFGGRQSPTRPLDELWVFDPQTRRLAQPSHVEGRPQARWGHSWADLPSDAVGVNHSGSRNLAVLVGGRNESEVFRDVWILSVHVSKESSHSETTDFLRLRWTQVDVSLSVPRFYHAAVLVALRGSSHNKVEKTHATTAANGGGTKLGDDNCVSWILLSGGLTTPGDLLGNRRNTEMPPIIWLRVSHTRNEVSLVEDWDASRNNGRKKTLNQALSSSNRFFGHTLCCVESGRLDDGEFSVIMRVGGCESDLNDDHYSGDTTSNAHSPLVEVFFVSSTGTSFQNKAPPELSPISVVWEGPEDRAMLENAGVWVNHTTNETTCPFQSSSSRQYSNSGLPASSTTFLLGGGTVGFAFGPQFTGVSVALETRLCRKSPTSSASISGEETTSFSSKSNSEKRVQPSNTMQSQGNVSPSQSTPAVVFVLFVYPPKVEKVRSLLEQKGYLDRRYRIVRRTIPVPNSGEEQASGSAVAVLAVPLTDAGEVWWSSCMTTWEQGEDAGVVDSAEDAWTRSRGLSKGWIASWGREHDLPLSTAMFAAQKPTRKKKNRC